MGKTICVIGAGLAGGITASTLAASGRSVVLVELGDATAPYLPMDEDRGGTEIKLPFTRGSGIGGTTNLWHGGLTILDPCDIEGLPGDRRPRMPISYRELRDYYVRALALIREQGRYTLDDIEAPPDTTVPGFGVGGDGFRLKALLYPDRPFSTRPLIQHAKACHGLKVISNVAVERVVGSGSRITHAVGIDVVTGRPTRIDADQFVLSAGGLGSPKVLLKSAAAFEPLGALPIGRFLIDHPTGFVFKAKLRRRMDLGPFFGVARREAKVRYGFALKPERMGDVEFRNHCLYLRPAISMKDPGKYDFLKRKLIAYKGRSLRPMDIAYLLRHSDLLFEAINFKYGLSYSTRYVSGLVFAEQFPNDGARIEMTSNGRFSIDWRIMDSDKRSLQEFIAMFAKQYSDLFETVTVFPDIGARLDTAGHHSGGCRMAATPSEGVVDADFKVFGTSNLFVVDGSVIGYSGHANTGLTIAALALRCCERLANG